MFERYFRDTEAKRNKERNQHRINFLVDMTSNITQVCIYSKGLTKEGMTYLLNNDVNLGFSEETIMATKRYLAVKELENLAKYECLTIPQRLVAGRAAGLSKDLILDLHYFPPKEPEFADNETSIDEVIEQFHKNPKLAKTRLTWLSFKLENPGIPFYSEMRLRLVPNKEVYEFKEIWNNY